MEYVIINAILYILTLFIYWRKSQAVDLGFVILTVFTIIAVLGVFNFYLLDALYKRTITFPPFVYLFIVLLMFIRPYLLVNYEDKIIKVRSLKKIEIIIYLYILSSFISVFIILPNVLKNISSGEWSQIRNDLYSDDLPVFYNNFIEHIALVFNQYFRLLSILVFFYFITLKKYSAKFLIVLGLSCVLPVFLMSVATSSRGVIVNLTMQLVTAYLLFKKHIPTKINRIFYFLAIFFIAIFLIYSIQVTNSRFGDDSGYQYSSNYSLLDYFGQPMLVFNDGVAGMYDFANGKYFFQFFLDILGLDSSFSQKDLGGSWGTGFFTFIGSFYIDFGPIGTFIIALFLPIFIKKNISGKFIYFENLFLYYFFYLFFLEGVFVTGDGAVLPWFFTILIYLFLKTSKRYG